MLVGIIDFYKLSHLELDWRSQGQCKAKHVGFIFFRADQNGIWYGVETVQNEHADTTFDGELVK